MDKELSDSLAAAVAALRQQRVIAYPTEAVFGLGCDPDSEPAVQALLGLKQRPWDKGLILIAADYQQLLPYVCDEALQGSAALPFSPTGLAGDLVMPARADTPRWLTGRFSTLAVRVSAHPQVQQLCRSYGKPLVSTSANLSGLPPAVRPPRCVNSLARLFQCWMRRLAGAKTHQKSAMH